MNIRKIIAGLILGLANFITGCSNESSAPISAYEHVSAQSGKSYFLHVRKSGGTMLFYFNGSVNPKEAVAEVPEGFEVRENEQTGLPFLLRLEE